MPEAQRSSKSSLSYLNGIEYAPNICYNGWKPGFEYSKNINLKNLNTKSVKLTYQVPKTRFFTTLFPKPICLSPGTTFTLPITFRPLERIVYDDFIEIYLIDFDKTFRIPLKGELPQFKIDFANELNLGSCAANEIIVKNFKINNLSELDTLFEWDIKEPFNVTPTNGQIKANSSVDVTFSFQPKGALVYKAAAVCRYGSDPLHQSNLFKSLELNGIGKFPHILLEYDNEISSEATINFGKILIGQTVTKHITIINMTEVKTDFYIERRTQIPSFDNCFNCVQSIGTLQPFEKQKIPIVYSPNTLTKDFYYDYFDVYSSGKLSKNHITCVAKNEIPRVTLEKDFLNFGLCNVGEQAAQTFKIINNSPLALTFQFDIDCETSTFKFSISNGTLKPNETKLIQVIFKPQHPIIYFKRIPCLIQNHDVLAIEMIGTAHSELMKPPIINRKNLEAYYYLKNQNLLDNSPEQLMELYTNKKIKFDENVIHEDYLKMQSLLAEEDSKLVTEEFIDDSHHFANTNKQNSLISLDQFYVDFGASKLDLNDEQTNEQKSVTVQNRTKGKIILFWNVSENSSFTITPNSCEIPPLKSYSFRIKFIPRVADQFYSTKFEGYALFKTLCDYTLADPKFVLPSWCLNIDCMGHTFHPSNDTFFLPKYTIDAESIIFPANVIDKPTYRTLVVKNTSSNYPLAFNFSYFNNNELSIKPLKGVIRKNEHQIFLFKFVSKTTDTYFVDKCEITLNYLKKHLLEIALVGVVATPLVNLENDGILYFSPTCKSNSTYQSYEIKNLSRSKINYEWKIFYESKNIFSVDQTHSTLQPYETKKCIWKFSPEKIDKYNHKVVLVAWVDEEKRSSKAYNLRLLGNCTIGSLQAHEMYKDFGSVIVGSSISSEMIIINNNDCDLDFEVSVKQTTDESASSSNKLTNDLCVLELETINGHIQARSKFKIRCRLRPTRLINYQFTIEYRIIYPNETNNNNSLEELNDSSRTTQKEILCYMTANGVFPKLRINDIKALGSASTLSRDYLWKLISINQLNSTMSCEPNPDELIYSIATRQEANRRLANQYSKPIIDMNFNAAPLNSDDTQIILFMENIGLVPTEWILLFPKDLLLELEYWAQTGEYDLDELEEMKIQDNKLFTIEPRKGHLEPGEIVQIQITYKHMFAGQNRLPILMKIAKGREIMFNLIGTTVANGEPSVYFPSTLFEFEPLEIGLNEYPIQIYELYNGGDVAVEVEIDATSIEQLNQENYSQKILECLSPSRITIQPGSMFETKWKFSPIEAKTYSTDIVFKINGYQFNVVTFKCIGFDKRKLNNMIISSKFQDNQEIQSIELPNQLATLSLDRVNFGEIPLFSRERKVLFVKNNSSQHKITFTWHVTNPDHIKFIRIQPSRGVVERNQSKMCKLTFLSKEKPSFYNIDLICEIKNESDMETYRQNLQLWEQEQRRQFEEFIIDENELESRLRGSNKVAESKDIKPIEKNRGSQLSWHRFKTIPPIIKNNLIEESNLARVRRLREEKKLWRKPLPPTPFLLHLNLLARTQYIEEYLSSKNMIKNDCEKFVDPLLGDISDKPKFGRENNTDEILNDDVKLICTEEESDAISFVICDLIRNLISDKSFHIQVQKIKDEPIPYFFQYYNEHNSKSTDNTDNTTRSKTDKNHQIKSGDKSSKSRRKSVEKTEEKTQRIKMSPMFGSFVESILENIISNILIEAFNKEFNLTSRPRLIALPPKSSNSLINNSLNGIYASNKSKNFEIMTSASPTLSVKSIDFSNAN